MNEYRYDEVEIDPHFQVFSYQKKYLHKTLKTGTNFSPVIKIRVNSQILLASSIQYQSWRYDGMVAIKTVRVFSFRFLGV